MTLAEQQRLLARLVTDPDLRSAFFRDPAGTGVLETLPADRLWHYSQSLIKKRCCEAVRCLPLTFRALGPVRFRELFREHAERSTTCGPQRHRADAVAFVREYLQRGVAEALRPAAWIVDLAAYEAATLRWAEPRRRWLILRLRYHPQALMEAAMAASPLTEVPRRGSLVLWLRARSRNRPIRICF